MLNSFRDYQFTARNGYVSFGGFTLSNYADAWSRGDFGKHFLNSAIITIPAVLLALLLASMVAFVLARFSFKFNLAMLGLFIAANLLPQQALLIPLFRLYRAVPLPALMSDSELLLDSFWGLILINVAFQSGFCIFVLSNYMRAAAGGDVRGRAGGRRERLAAVLADHDAAGPAPRWPRSGRCSSPGSTTSSSGPSR